MRGEDWAFSFNGGLLFNVRPGLRVAAAVHRGPTFNYHLILPDGAVTPGQFHTPDTYTLGIVSQPTDVLTIAAEYRRVNYSSLHRGFVDVIVGPNGEPEQFTVRDAHELHAGVEYVMADVRMTPGLRLGTWFDPSHEVGFTRSTTMNPYFNSLFSAALRGGKDLIHVTGGLGLSLSPRLEFNIAADVTSGNRIVSASTILRF